MADNYTGWKLFDKVTVVAKPRKSYNYRTGETETLENCQGYVVDPNNKKQLENAIKWATTYEYTYEEDENGNKKCTGSIAVPPEQFTYDNDGFELELYKSADGSSQGGKLSFWNCWITAPDGHRFLIGIAADLLLDVLKSSTVVNGVVQDKLMFARCKGGVGMLSPNMSSYKDALKDEASRKNNSRGKTSKHKIGYVYETLTQKNLYAGDVYRWYEPIYEEKESNYFPYHKANQLVGFKKLAKPVKLMWFPTYYENESIDWHVEHFGSYELETKLPARKEGIKVDQLPDLQKCIDKIEKNYEDAYKERIDVKQRGLSMATYVDTRVIGLSVNSEEYTLPSCILSYIKLLGYKIEE